MSFMNSATARQNVGNYYSMREALTVDFAEMFVPEVIDRITKAPQYPLFIPQSSINSSIPDGVRKISRIIRAHSGVPMTAPLGSVVSSPKIQLSYGKISARIYKNILGYVFNKENDEASKVAEKNIGPMTLDVMRASVQAIVFELSKSVDFTALWGNDSLGVEGYYNNSEIVQVYAELDPVSNSTDFLTKSPTVIIQDFINLQSIMILGSQNNNNVTTSALPPSAFLALEKPVSQTATMSIMEYITKYLKINFVNAIDLESVGTEQGNSTPTGRCISWDANEKERIFMQYKDVASAYTPFPQPQDTIIYDYKNQLSNILLPRPIASSYLDDVSYPS